MPWHRRPQTPRWARNKDMAVSLLSANPSSKCPLARAVHIERVMYSVCSSDGDKMFRGCGSIGPPNEHVLAEKGRGVRG